MPRKDTGFPTDPAMIRRQRDLLAGHFQTLFAGPLAFWGPAGQAADAVDAFLAVWPNRPIPDNTGGSGFNDSLSIFVLARLSGARRVIESGTHRGHSAWLFRQALPGAMIDSFDVNHGNLQYRAEGVRFHERDWNAADLTGDADSLVFFDDHMSHARRLIEARERGFTRILLDDNVPAHALFATGTPPFPTLEMIVDDGLKDGQRFTWQRNGKPFEATLDGDLVRRAREILDRYAVLPDLADVTLYGPQSRLTAVTLKSD
ncbi:MAG: hypothetical protein NXI16_11340 [Alphaproteobacteria bacterium]|nr:hypothetical protein [Alphaproteobacteria bacterium]